jgi:hypothetical protein
VQRGDWFFHCYIIPLAKKLESYGVFGVSSDEYLTYALENRKEWVEKGEAIVARMVDKYIMSRLIRILLRRELRARRHGAMTIA